MDSWQEYSQHVIKSLDRLERKLDDHAETAQLMQAQHLIRHGELEKQIQLVAKDVTWFARIASGIGFAGSILVNWVLGRLK